MDSRLPQDFSDGRAAMDPQAASFRSSGWPRSPIIAYSGFWRRIAPRVARRSLETLDALPPRPRHASTQSVSSLAAATLLGLAQTQRMPLLSDAAGSSLRSILGLRRSDPSALELPFIQPQTHPSQPNLSPPSPDGTLERKMDHHDSSDLSPIMSAFMPTSVTFSVGEQGRTTGRVPHHLEAMTETDMDALTLSSGQGALLLPMAETNGSSFLSDETNANVHPMPIPQHMRPRTRPLSQAGSISNLSTYNSRRFLGGPPNRSSSSLLTNTTFVTAPTGTSPPHSIQSILRCESPGLLPSTYRRTRVQSNQASSLRQSVVADNFDHEDHWTLDRRFLDHDHRPITFEQSRSPGSGLSAHSSMPSRKILIIGSSYKDRGEVKRMFSIESLDGVFEDRDQLKTLFKERSYSVQTMIEEGFNKERALLRIAEFLRDARSGDVRAIVFTGHGHANDDGTVWLVPPECPSTDEAISRTEWDKNIRENSQAGVVVFSIMAHCHSGDVMQQEFGRRILEDSTQIENARRDEPIFLTFAASDAAAFESLVTRPSQPDRTSDHFIHALVGAIRSINVATDTWKEFFEEFDRQFRRARSCASWQDKLEAPSIPNWRLNNHQIPRFSASRFVRLSVVF